jgi:hypothetical protein
MFCAAGMDVGRLGSTIGAILAITVAAGCAAPPVSDRSTQLDDLRASTAKVSIQEKQCTLTALKRSDDAIGQIVSTPDPTIEMRMQAVVDQRDRDLAACETNADRENEELSEGERSEYELEAREQMQRTAMTVLVTSQH